MFENALTGYLKGKAILFITNQLQYLPFADKILVLNEGKQVAFGHFKELMATNDFFKDMMRKFGEIDEKKKEDEEKKDEKPAKQAKPEAKKPAAPSAKPGSLTKLEEKTSGLVSAKVYWYYIKAGRPWLFFIIIACYAASVAANIGSCKNHILRSFFLHFS